MSIANLKLNLKTYRPMRVMYIGNNGRVGVNWLGTWYISRQNRIYLPFEEARKYVRKLGLKNGAEWSAFCKSGNKPQNIPMAANDFYKEEWKGLGDWLGTGKVATRNIKYRSFSEARSFIRKLKLKNQHEWEEYCKSGNKPKDIPQKAYRTYSHSWKGFGDWLGTNFVATQNRNYRSFEKARKYVRSLGIKNQDGWRTYCKTGTKPNDIPSTPGRTYKKEWKGFGDWLGTGVTSTHERKHLPFEEAREFAHSLKLGSNKEWVKYCKSGNKPKNIPADPRRRYIQNWKGWGDWLGTGYTVDRVYRPYSAAREFVHSLGLESRDAWNSYCNTGSRPIDIPSNPDKVYDEKEWKGYADWIGYEGTWTTVRIKGLLRDLIESKIIYQWDEAVLYSLLLRRGLLNLDVNNNRHSKFFKNLIEVVRTEQGKKIIEEYAYSNSEVPPDISNIKNTSVSDSGEIETASLSDIANPENKDPLDYGNIESVEQILEHTNVLESFNVDEEAMQFYLLIKFLHIYDKKGLKNREQKRDVLLTY